MTHGRLARFTRDDRFLINQPVGDATATPIALMLNWDSERKP